MVGQEDRRDRFERISLLLRQQWIQADDWAADFGQMVWDAVLIAWLWAEKRPILLRWAIVFGSVLFSMVVGQAMHANAPAHTQFLILLPAVMVSSLYGGMFAGAIASLVGAITTVSLKMTVAPGTLGPNFVSLAMYGVACGIILCLSRAQRVQRHQIQRFAETLELKVQERTADLEAANREVSDFCYSISHDMRAPMRSMVSSSRILLEDVGPALDSDSRQRIQGIANAANQLASWVDDLLGYARLGNTELRPEWVNVTQMVEEICGQLSDQDWEFSSIKLHLQPNLVLTGDKFLIRTALGNILENSYKYAKKGQPLAIEVTEWQTNKGVFLCIRDNGIGFEPKYANKIFEPFQRLHRECEYPGSGIGLANVKRIVDRHGGEITAEGHPHVGSTFFLRFGSGRTEGRAVMSNT